MESGDESGYSCAGFVPDKKPDDGGYFGMDGCFGCQDAQRKSRVFQKDAAAVRHCRDCGIGIFAAAVFSQML